MRHFRVDLGSVKKNQMEIPELKTMQSEIIKYSLEKIHSLLVTMEERIKGLKHRFNRINQTEAQKKRTEILSLCRNQNFLCYPNPDPLF